MDIFLFFAVIGGKMGTSKRRGACGRVWAFGSWGPWKKRKRCCFWRSWTPWMVIFPSFSSPHS